MGPIIKEIIAKDKDGTKFGLNFLPKTATASRGSIGTCGASSFRERVNSYAYADGIVTKGSTLLGDDEIGMLAILRMNKKFMSFMRRHNPDLKNQLPSAHACMPRVSIARLGVLSLKLRSRLQLLPSRVRCLREPSSATARFGHANSG